MKKDNPDCPCCHIALVQVKYQGFAVHHCEQCKGYLVRSGRYVAIKSKAKEELATGPHCFRRARAKPLVMGRTGTARIAGEK